MFDEQVVDLLACYDTLYPIHQVLVEMDYSSSHVKGREGGLESRQNEHQVRR